MYDHLLKLPLNFYGRRRSGDLISSMTNDVAAIQQAVSLSMAEVIQYMLMLLGILGGLFWLHWRMALVALLVLPLAALGHQQVRRPHPGVQQAHARENRRHGGAVGRNHRRDACREGFYDGRADAQPLSPGQRAQLRRDDEIGSGPGHDESYRRAILVVGMVLVLWFGGREVIAGRLTVGELMAFLAYLGMLSQPVSALTHHFSLIQQAAAAGNASAS